MIFFTILFLFSKIEYDTRSYYQAKSLIDPILKKFSNRIIQELSYVLRDDLSLAVGKNTSSIFRYQRKFKSPTLITRFFNKLTYTPFLNDDRQIVFIDKESLINYDSKHILYFGNLSSKNNIDILIDIYKKIKRHNLNIKYFEVEICTHIKYLYKEIKVDLQNVGTIHETIYHNKHLVYEKIINHFKNFYSNKKLYNVKCYVISKMYIDSLKNIFEVTDVIENFPFKFFDKLCDSFNRDMIVTGGICFKDKRFIVSFLCTFEDDKVTLIKL